MYRRDKLWYMSYLNFDFSTLLHMPFSFYDFFFGWLLEAQGVRAWYVKYSSGYPLWGEAVHFPLGVGTIMGSLMIKEAHLGPIGTRVMAMRMGLSSCIGFCPRAKCVSWPSFAFCGTFLYWMWPIMLLLFVLAASTSGASLLARPNLWAREGEG